VLPERIDNRIMPVTESGCWLWLGPLVAEGYGITFYRGKNRRVHRIVYQDRVGDLSDHQMLCHSCDVMCCCNPDHLYKGTSQSNVNDMISRGRHIIVRGERNGQAKLTASQVRAIRASSEHYKVLAARYGVHPMTIYKVRDRSRWQHV
jgi:hypothetical protein